MRRGKYRQSAGVVGQELMGSFEPTTTGTNVEVAETEARPDLIWDNEVPGLCVRVHGNGAQSFIFVYRRDGRQRFVRIGTTPRWSLGRARRWAKELRSALLAYPLGLCLPLSVRPGFLCRLDYLQGRGAHYLFV